MELSDVKIKGFKSVKEPIELLVDKRVTIFIGANDHGKSNLLTAIEHLNDDKPTLKEEVHWDMLEENPRIEWHFTCSDKVIKQMQGIVSASPPAPAPEPEPAPAAATAATVQETVPTPTATPETKEKNDIPADEPKVELLPTNKEKKLILIRDGVSNPITILSAPIEIPKLKEAEIIALKPRAELFKPPSIDLKDETTLAQLNSETDFEFMQGIFRLAKIWDDRETIFTIDDSTTRKLKEASETLTKVLNSTWNQGKDLIWHLIHTEGNKIGIFIQDPAIGSRFTRPSLKSSGFQTYFLLSMITYARTEASQSNSFIYLFDEPGTNLHPRAQIDLQRSLEALSDTTQIVYTTHSLFLINKNYPDRNTVVTKTPNGTKVNVKPFQRNWKAVRESLGILLSNNFLIAEKTVFVEGPSDVIYLLHTIKTLKKLGKVDIDLNDLSIVDAGDASNYVAMAKLMLEEGRNIYALLDGDPSGDKNKKQLEKTCGPELTTKNLEIKQLPGGKSSEDILANQDNLRAAILSVAQDLTSKNIRKLKEGVVLEAEVKKIKGKAGETLGKIIDDTTKSWFEPEEKMSKLSIALKYEDIGELSVVDTEAIKLIKDMNKTLDLREEKAYEEGVFEEV